MASNTFTPAYQQQPGSAVEAIPGNSTIIVVGAGAFGGWTSWFLQQHNYKVILIDSWGPGNSRSSSGDETRIIRSTYGPNEFYFNMNVRALTLWKEYEQRWQKKFFLNKGVLWFSHHEKSSIVDDSVPFAQNHNMPYEKLSVAEVNKRFPLINTSDLHHTWYDSFGGCLQAREACHAVQQAFIAEGGTYIQATVTPGTIKANRMNSVQLSDGCELKADAYIFACGAWLASLFPEVLGNFITCTKQEVYYLGVPNLLSAVLDNYPVWVDLDGTDFYYGIPGNNYRGFKIGVDKQGELFNPTWSNRTFNPSVLSKALEFISHRFPVLKGAPVIESRVCPYENSPDGNFLFDNHPEAANVFFLGGGSGHGFKHGPALGELVANIIKGESTIPRHFLLSRA
jgi:glycine/D-amino acid oxidase-like deaminating enzyme